MKLTKRVALEICMELWKWLERNATTSNLNEVKALWPGWKEYGRMREHCPCCAYAEMDNRRCQACPLISLWKFDCEGAGSPYRKWCREGDPKYARMIWKACDKELKKMDERNKKARERRRKRNE